MQYDIASSLIEIRFPTDGKIRSRKVVKRSNARNTGKYPSWKMQRMMQWESENEANAMRMLDAHPGVLSFHEQPCEIIYQLDGQRHRHYPDFLVKKQHNRIFVEVKSRADASQPEVSRRTAFLERTLPTYGYGYRIMLAEDLAIQPRLDNLKRLLHLGRQYVPLIERERIRQLFLQQPTILWGFFDIASLRMVCRLILEGMLCIDMQQPISDNSPIRGNFSVQL